MVTMDQFHCRRFRHSRYKYASWLDSCHSAEYHEYISELEVALDWYTHSRCRHLYDWNHCWKGEQKRCDPIHEWREVEYQHAWLQNHPPAVVRLICILSFLCGHPRNSGCKRCCRSTSLKSEDTVDEDPCFVNKMKCPHNVQKRLNGLLAINTITSRQVLGKCHTLIYFFQQGVLPVLLDFANPPSHVCKVFNRSVNYNIP